MGGLDDERAEFQLESKALHHLLSRFREQTNIIWKRRFTFMRKWFENTITM